ncbi:alkaline phosphatase [Cellulophaga sp. HaHa_2_1]|uniref:alkaline phosphatase n=1 Tax=Cellulophaga sp. HaHa_2_1 TaxID=2749994 RepID=UPI001C4F69C8|nr:alkaline phosphatase [Cellulophaga sp. HaHa_2_1]QXP52653.1 alkaline phosphatase [Cellulophaga sp. HaHa_2_1]
MFLLKKIVWVVVFFITIASYGQEKNTALIHSHNDYLQSVPFWTAFSNGLNSIEVDVYLNDKSLNVAHTEAEIDAERTLEKLYLEPLNTAIENKIGTVQQLILMIDVKSDAITTLNAIIESLKKYPKIIEHPEIKIVVSGNRPDAENYRNYPEFIFFDHQKITHNLSDENWERVAMVSTSFKQYSHWNGKGRLTHEDLENVTRVVAQAKSLGKTFRFWATPDSNTAWRTFVDLGVDVINTDAIYECSKYVRSLDSRIHKATIFSEVYTPNFKSDNRDKPIKNIILMIGDGTGLSQISAAALANKGELTLTQLKSMGFVKTQAADDFTTDSAAGATAMATGIKTNNRAIGTDSKGEPIPNIIEILSKKGYKTGIITTDEITGATPSSFYAHQIDRSETLAIAKDLIYSPLNFFAGGGKSTFHTLPIASNFSIINQLNELSNQKVAKVGFFLSENGVPSMSSGRGNLLAETTKQGISFLSKDDAPFFLLVEGAQIDSFGHYNDIGGLISEAIDFDTAITEAIKFADRDGETLVVITADHETSGLSLLDGDMNTNKIEADFASHDHTGVMVPIFAYGPSSGKFQGVYENSALFTKILNAINK